jgi:hypothetical protein
MERIMTVTDLVRDTCKAATRLAERGNSITVKSGNRVLFLIVPSAARESKMSPRQYAALLRDLDEMAAAAPLDENPIVELRWERM